MKPITIAFSFLLLCSSMCLVAQNAVHLELPAKRTYLPVKIDGILNDSAWKDASLMANLIEFRPKVGAKESYENRTETWLMYSDDGIYFGGYCHERTKDSIASELKGRDGFGTNDYIGIILDTYKDHLNGFEYFITPLGEQWDSKMSPPAANSDNGGEDFTWNAVWQSATVIHEDGWSFEMFIPYSAIRFGKKDVQEWGLNITRRRRKTEQQYTWNPIDVNVNGFLTQEGYWTGITNIKPPLRLQFSPYFSVYANHFPAHDPAQKNWTSEVNGGLDVKYGINQSFTFDATLIPDFGQVQSDNQVLNLTPFEVQFNENRSFFTEGTELFGKGGLFYSRRIGNTTPIHYYDAYDDTATNERVIKNPVTSKLINASKISGRTKNGLGIGILNAITKEQFATIENTSSKEFRKFETEPLTNYNVFILDQTLKHNSSISLVNTNVMRSGKDYDANVTAGLFDLNDKKNTWNTGGKIAVSNLMGYQAVGKTQTGYSHNFYVGKISGRLTFNLTQELSDTKYSHNDLGYFTNNNFLNHSGYIGYRWTEPKGWYNRIFINFNFLHSTLFSRIAPIHQKFQSADLSANINIQTKKIWWIGAFIDYKPEQNDFYEPRTDGWFFHRGPSIAFGPFYESNAAKKYSMIGQSVVRKFFNFYNIVSVDIFVKQNYRFNNNFSAGHQIGYNPTFNSVGYAATDNNQIIFGRRKVNTVENILSLKYSFTNKMGITFRARHYLSTVDYKEFFTLQQSSGRLSTNSSFNQPINQNVNIFNIDMVYTWQFAPGSFINVVWKNSVYDEKNILERSYFKNFGNTMETDQNNNLSLKVIYFFDALQLKKKKKI